MRRIPAPPDRDGRRLDGVRYPSEGEYLEARRKRDERRARLLAQIYARRGWGTDDDAEDW
jgi:hypothetical protein